MAEVKILCESCKSVQGLSSSACTSCGTQLIPPSLPEYSEATSSSVESILRSRIRVRCPACHQVGVLQRVLLELAGVQLSCAFCSHPFRMRQYRCIFCDDEHPSARRDWFFGGTSAENSWRSCGCGLWVCQTCIGNILTEFSEEHRFLTDKSASIRKRCPRCGENLIYPDVRTWTG